MAARTRSIFILLTRNCRNRSTISRSLSSSRASRAFSGNVENDDLISKIGRLMPRMRSATKEILKIEDDLRDISKESLKLQRFKHALEISEWMIAHKDFELSDADFATRIDLMTKVFGIDCAERYFESLPPLHAYASSKLVDQAKDLFHRALKSNVSSKAEIYNDLATKIDLTAEFMGIDVAERYFESLPPLLASASSKLVDQAKDLFDRALKSNVSSKAMICNGMMMLYMSIGQEEKVPLMVEEMKLQKVELDLFTYNLWISSCALSMNVKEVRTILDEMVHVSGSKEDWVQYIDLVNIYLTLGKFDIIEPSWNSMVALGMGMTQRQREWITYDFLVILFGGLGNKDKLDQIWKLLRMTKQKASYMNYTCILSSYLILGYLKEVSEIIVEWKQSAKPRFDIHACKKLLTAFEDLEMVEKAKKFHQVLTDQGCYTDES